MELNEITGAIVGAAMKVHTEIGPGVLESVYRKCLQHELQKCGLAVQSEVKLPVRYDGLLLESGYRLDLLVQNQIVIELKCVDALLPIHKAQLLTYLRLADKPLGLLLNFNVVHMRNGIQRVINSKCQSAFDAGQS
jgi:GxxExxY protein